MSELLDMEKQRSEQKHKQPLPPPCREFKSCLFGGETETKKSIQNMRDWRMFMKGYNVALGDPNIPQTGDYV